jgi:hypothetical protein
MIDYLPIYASLICANIWSAAGKHDFAMAYIIAAVGIYLAEKWAAQYKPHVNGDKQ